MLVTCRWMVCSLRTSRLLERDLGRPIAPSPHSQPAVVALLHVAMDRAYAEPLDVRAMAAVAHIGSDCRRSLIGALSRGRRNTSLIRLGRGGCVGMATTSG
jgi:hypothetical protein